MQEHSQPNRKLKVDMEELAAALEDASEQIKYYLDTETGEVVLLTEDILSPLNQIYVKLEEAGESGLTFDQALEQMKFPGWLNDAVKEADQVEEGLGTRYVDVPQADSREGYTDMEDFIETVQNESLQARLEDAISGRGAFRRFKDVLARFPQEQERWFQFKDARLRGRALKWLQEVGIEPEQSTGS